MSFGQFCGTVLIDAIERSGHIPDLESTCEPQSKKERAFSYIRDFSIKTKGMDIAQLSDDEIKDLIASRYE